MQELDGAEGRQGKDWVADSIVLNMRPNRLDSHDKSEKKCERRNELGQPNADLPSMRDCDPALFTLKSLEA